MILALAAAACVPEEDTGTGPMSVTTTTGAALARDSAVHKVAASRCQRAAECNLLGPGQMYESKDECLDREANAARVVTKPCTNGIDGLRLDDCLGMLNTQFCQADMGPVTAMNECKAYCAGTR